MNEKLDQAVLDAFQISPAPSPNLKRWNDVADRINNPEGEVHVAIVGKYTKLEDAYKSIAEALTHGGMANKTKVVSTWIDSEIFEKKNSTELLQKFNAILVPGGFGERGTEGKILAAHFARTKKVPYLGICLGMQMAVIEAARNLVGISSAGSEEFNEGSLDQGLTPIIYLLKEWYRDEKKFTRSSHDDKGGSMRLGAYHADLVLDSKVQKIYQTSKITERHRHRYEVDIKYKSDLEKYGMIFSGVSPDGKLPEIVELKDHPWYIGVQFHPELKSKPFAPHPLFRDFIRAALDQSRLV